jgi:hypothetical protein
MGGACSTYGGTSALCYWQGNLREGENLEDLDVDGRIISNGSSRTEMGAFNGLIWLGIERSGGFL